MRNTPQTITCQVDGTQAERKKKRPAMKRHKHDNALKLNQILDIVYGRTMKLACGKCDKKTNHIPTILLDEADITFLIWYCETCGEYDNYWTRLNEFVPN